GESTTVVGIGLGDTDDDDLCGNGTYCGEHEGGVGRRRSGGRGGEHRTHTRSGSGGGGTVLDTVIGVGGAALAAAATTIGIGGSGGVSGSGTAVLSGVSGGVRAPAAAAAGSAASAVADNFGKVAGRVAKDLAGGVKALSNYFAQTSTVPGGQAQAVPGGVPASHANLSSPLHAPSLPPPLVLVPQSNHTSPSPSPLTGSAAYQYHPHNLPVVEGVVVVRDIPPSIFDEMEERWGVVKDTVHQPQRSKPVTDHPVEALEEQSGEESGEGDAESKRGKKKKGVNVAAAKKTPLNVDGKVISNGVGGAGAPTIFNEGAINSSGGNNAAATSSTVQPFCNNLFAVAHWKPHSNPVSHLAFNPNQTLLVTGSTQANTFYVWELPGGIGGGSQTSRKERGGGATSTSHQLDQDTPARRHRLRHFPRPARCLYKLERGYTPATIEDVAFSLDSRFVGVSTARGTTHIYMINPGGHRNSAALMRGTRAYELGVLNGLTDGLPR
ncbi:hypothetical protein HK102_010844, partial [Quaeritorhiza haematococci]